jgi:hypothetical protein
MPMSSLTYIVDFLFEPMFACSLASAVRHIAVASFVLVDFTAIRVEVYDQDISVIILQYAIMHRDGRVFVLLNPDNGRLLLGSY